VTGSAQPPLRFLDVDGPLIPFGAAQCSTFTNADRAWVSARHPGQALLHRVDAGLGFTGADYVVLDGWLRGTYGRLAIS
jgi:hypothetical protein